MGPVLTKPSLSGRKTSQRHLRSSQSLCRGSTPRRSKRLEDKCREALRYLHPETPKRTSMLPGSRMDVLVTDTPESEYHLTFKQRQQLKIGK